MSLRIDQSLPKLEAVPVKVTSICPSPDSAQHERELMREKDKGYISSGWNGACVQSVRLLAPPSRIKSSTPLIRIVMADENIFLGLARSIEVDLIREYGIVAK